MNITPSQALLIGAALISATIWFGLSHEPFRYQAANFAPGIVAVVDTKTGGIELCGNVLQFAQLSTGNPDILRAAGFSEAEITKYVNEKIQGIQTTHCFILSEHSGM